MKCKICATNSNLVKKLIVRKKYEARYYLCDNCGFMFVDNPTWLAEAYQKPIDITDTGYVMRNIYLSKKVLLLFALIFGKSFTYLDYAGGYGMLARIMRDYGLNFLNDDLYAKNLFVQGFEYRGEKIKALTCFECFEHLESPIEEFEKMLKISKNIFFSTRLLPATCPPNDEWEYYGLDHGQHVAFYSIKTIEFLAKKYNLYFNTNKDNLHFLSERKISPIIFKAILLLSKLQFDILIRKTLNSKTTSDSMSLKKI